MQWKLTRALALSGAAEAPEDFNSDDDDREGGEDVLVQREEKDEDNK